LITVKVKLVIATTAIEAEIHHIILCPAELMVILISRFSLGSVYERSETKRVMPE